MLNLPMSSFVIARRQQLAGQRLAHPRKAESPRRGTEILASHRSGKLSPGNRRQEHPNPGSRRCDKQNPGKRE
jgi:hypothetical protein